MANKPKTSIICCISKNRGIGKDNKLLFDIPNDLKHFRQITQGHPVIMGYKTYQSIGRPLPGRLNVILSSQTGLTVEGCVVVHEMKEAIRLAAENDDTEIFFIGGGVVYKQSMKFADRLYLTIVDAKPDADTYFPDYSEFSKVVSEMTEESNGYKYKYIVLER